MPINKQIGAIKYELLYPLYIPNAAQFELEQNAFELLGLATQNERESQKGNIVFYDPISHEINHYKALK
ncbi:MAG: hypothetical protein IPQ19_01735 [Bacteroidetes bacterium]|nr:hypothetical protein [Bacteroidota bacterium]